MGKKKSLKKERKFKRTRKKMLADPISFLEQGRRDSKGPVEKIVSLAQASTQKANERNCELIGGRKG